MRSRLYSLWPAVVAVIAACALGILGLPAAASAAVPGISVQRVWTDKASYAPGETIRFNAEIDNSLGGTVLAQGHCSANSFPVCLSISTSPSFFTNGRSADFPPGASTWSWNTTAPSSQGQYTFKVTAFDGFNGNFSERTADSFTIGSSVTVSRTYVANEKWAEANQFSPGDLVRYQIVVSATAKVTINARMLVTGPQSRTILDTGGDIEVSPSAGSVYFQSTIPSDAPLGTYTEKATVTFSGHSTVPTSTFSVTQATDNGQPPAVVTPYADAAANWAWARRTATTTTLTENPNATSWSGWCEAFVEAAYRAAGHSIPVYDSANAHKDAKNSILQTGLPPRGAIVFYVHDHVVISMGDGTVVGTWNYPAASTTPNHVDKYSDALDGAYVGWYLP